MGTNFPETPRTQLLHFIKEKCIQKGQFQLSSGVTSTVYVDLRVASLHPQAHVWLGDVLWEKVRPLGVYGVAAEGLGGTPLVSAVTRAAFDRGVSLFGALVRKQPKAHGAGLQVEGVRDWPVGASVVVLEDTVTTGSSVALCKDALEKSGFCVKAILGVLQRGDSHEITSHIGKHTPWECLFKIKDLEEIP